MAPLPILHRPYLKEHRWCSAAPVWALLVLFLLHSFSFTLIHAGFSLNQAYIAKKLCENRDKPQLKCEGRCVLIKSLKKAAQTEQDLRVHLKQLSFDFTAAESLTGIAPCFAASSAKYIISSSLGLPEAYSPSLYHPPQA